MTVATRDPLAEPDSDEPPALESAPADAPGWEPAPRGWYLAIASGTFPPLLLGFAASALANRLAFVGWAVVAALGHALLVRSAWARGWSAAARAALALGWAAVTFVSFASLATRHGEILDLGTRALLWPIYTPALTRPDTWLTVAGALAALSLVSAALAWRRRRGRA